MAGVERQPEAGHRLAELERRHGACGHGLRARFDREDQTFAHRVAGEAGLWLEIVTLVFPGFNDSTAELMDAARYLASISPNIPWHVTAFHPDYKMTEPDRTTAQNLIRAAEIGQEAGLNFVYAGNLPGQVGDYENTHCPQCHQLLVSRIGYVITGYTLTDDGCCPQCGSPIPGIWPQRAEVRLGTAADLFQRVPRRVR